MKEQLTIIKPVVDLRASPEEISSQDFSHHDLRNTQLLYNDPVELIEKSDNWLHVRALRQSCFRENKGWHAYDGWIHESEATRCPLLKPTHVVKVKSFSLDSLMLSYGTYLTLDEDEILLPTGERIHNPHPMALRSLLEPLDRKTLCTEALLFLDDPYLWGGTASYLPSTIASVDCSGLIYLLYRSHNRLLPRDAHDQWLVTEPILKENLLPGDLLYLAREDKPQRISHVLLYVKEGWFLESPMSGEKVRTFPIETHVKEQGDLICLKGREKRYFPHYRRVP